MAETEPKGNAGTMSNRHATVGEEISDKVFYNNKHSEAADKAHLDRMEKDALYFLEGIRRQDQGDPTIAQDLEART